MTGRPRLFQPLIHFFAYSDFRQTATQRMAAFDFLIATLTLLVTQGTPTLVSGSGKCPAAADVQAQLNRLVSGGDRQAESYSAHLVRERDTITITLEDVDAQIIASRTLSQKASCEDLVAAAAVIIATWEVELRGRGNLGLWQPVAPTLAAATTTTTPRWSIGGGFGYAFASDSPAPGLWLHAARRREQRRLQWHAAFATNHAYRITLGQGDAEWSRIGACVGPALGTLSQRYPAELALLAGASWLSMRGVDQFKNKADFAVDPEVRLLVRMGVRLGNTVPWLAGMLVARPLQRTLALEPGTIERGMSILEVGVIAGLSFDI